MSKIEDLYSKFLSSSGVSIDTRTLKKGNLFFAINGPNFNANEFAADAIEKGASFAVVDDEKFVLDERFFLVEDGLRALQTLAKFHRSRLAIPMIGITGSNGKTTTKELIHRVLSKKYNVHSTKGNFNNHIGVPLTILDIKTEIEIAIIEMGANHVGEIAGYCEIANPTQGLITNIGRAHTETFGGIEGVIRGKSELYDYLRKNEGTVFINMDDSVLSNMAKRFDEPIKYPSSDLILIGTTPYLKIRFNQLDQETKLIGKYNYINIAAAIALGKYFKVEEAKILSAIATYEPDNARSEIIKKGSTTIILDAYNANPDSMKVALESLVEQEGKKVAILGDMNEVENSVSAHQEVLNFGKELGIESIFTVGDKIGKVADSDYHFESKEKLEEYLSELNLENTSVLLKASRSIKLETIIKSFK